MKSIKELERDKKDKIKELSVDEAERYINKLNKEMAEAWGSLDNSFKIDADTMMRNSNLCDEAVELLNHKYKMELMVSTSRLNALVEKHAADIEDVKDLILATSLHGLMSSYWQISHNILILTQLLNILYENYWITPADLEEYIDMTNAAEEDKIKIISEVDDIPEYDLYHKHFMNTLEFNIKHMASIIDQEMIILKRLIHFQFKEDDTAATGTYYDKFKEGMMEYQKLSQELIADYEELKRDGFKNAKTLEAEAMAKCLDMEVDYWNEVFKESRPSYDVNNFIFIPPQLHIESMRENHPDWKEDAANDNEYDDEEGVDEWYAEVTNPIL